MRHGKKGRQLSRTASHREALLRNMAAALIKHENLRGVGNGRQAMRDREARVAARDFAQGQPHVVLMTGKA